MTNSATPSSTGAATAINRASRRQSAGGGEDTQGYRKVEGRALLPEVRWSKVDDHLLGRELVAAVFYLQIRTLFRF